MRFVWIVTLVGMAVVLFVEAARSAISFTSYASRYGPGLYGNGMGCGGKLRPWTIGVAHKTLPCGTRLRICYVRCAVARVLDRGPFVTGRDLDLTYAFAARVGLVGVQRVRWTVLR